MPLSLTLKSEGEVMDPTYQVRSVDIRREIDRVPWAEITLHDGSAVTQQFAVSDSGFFALGKGMEILLRPETDGEDATVFKGLIVRSAVEVLEGTSCLVVGLKDAAVKLTGMERSAIYRETSDSEILATLVQDAGLRKGTWEPTQPRHPELVRHGVTDWQFMGLRARAHGLCLVTVDGAVALRKPDPALEPSHTFAWGKDALFELEMEVDASRQWAGLTTQGWSADTLDLTPPSQAEVPPSSSEGYDGQALASQLGFQKQTLQHVVEQDAAELEAWANGAMARRRGALLRGRLAVPGFADAEVLSVVAVEGVGKHWNGKGLVTGVRHRVDSLGWRTDLQLGMPRPETAAHGTSSAAQLLPPLQGLRLGVVADFVEDPLGAWRLKVRLAGMDAEDAAVWARLLSPDAGPGRGFYSRPAVGDEVVVGCLSDDPRHAVVLGSLFGVRNAPPEGVPPLGADNFVRGWYSKKGLAWWLDDERPAMEWETPGGHRMVFDDADKSLRIEDLNGNALILGDGGIEIRSAKDLKLSAQGKVEIRGSTVDVQ